MPLDTSILTSQPTALDTLGKLNALRAQNNNNALAQQQIQGQGLENQQKQMQMAGTQALNEAMRTAMTTDAQGNPTFDTKGIAQHLASSNQGHLIPTVLEGLQKVQQTNADIQEKTATAAKANQAVQDAKTDYQGMLGLSVRDAGYSPQAALAVIAHALATKNLDPQTAQQLSAKIVANPDPQAIQQMVDPMITLSQKAQQTLQERAAANAHNATAQKEMALLPGQLQSQKLQQTELQQKTTGQVPLTAKDQAELAMKKQQLGIEASNASTNRGRLAVEQQRYGFEANGGVSPAAQMIAQGKLDPQTTRTMLRSNPGLITQIKSADPNFDEGNIDNRFNTLKEFSSSSATKAGGQVLALNTMIHHADLYQKTAEALNNGSFKPGNAIYNEVASVFGKAPPTNAALVARFFAGETGKVATGGVPAEGEINGVLKNLSTSNSPEAIKGAGDTLMQIGAGRMTPLMEKAKEAHIDNIVHVLGPDAQAILQRNGYDPNTLAKKTAGGSAAIAVSAPNGKTYHFKSQSDADNFKREAGLK